MAAELTSPIQPLVVKRSCVHHFPACCHRSPYRSNGLRFFVVAQVMFCEPTRPGRLLRRPGNALSNFVYVFGAACVLHSTLLLPAADSGGGGGGGGGTAFWVADAMFGVMLLLLGLTSVSSPRIESRGTWRKRQRMRIDAVAGEQFCAEQ